MELEHKIIELIKLQRENNDLLKKLIFIFGQYDESYTKEIAKDGIKNP